MFRHLLLFLFLTHTTMHADNTSSSKTLLERLSKEEKLVYTNAAIASGVLIWGFTQWGYGEEKFHFDDEGWFGKETSNGGSDKLGHFYTNYLVTRILAPIYENWGYSNTNAGLYAALTAGITSGVLIELGDGFSEHGFSKEDFIADVLGAAAGYFWYINPALAEKIDFRVEYAPSLNSDNTTDFTTDYEHMKHLLAVKANGFETFQNSYMQYLELHIGYYTRDFNHDTMPIEDRKRYLYAGVGLNLSKLLRPHIGKYATIFNYYQMPYTYVPVEKQF
ncbi:MAG: DUF2279 domain-containing protein [Campylobacterota bacterium]|nr:DUF2279 domain-containing protein [Campylobacterota bacterium]